MEPDSSDNRREPRFPVKTGATVEVQKCGEIAGATTVNISGCGVLLEFKVPTQLAVGDPVVCEFDVTRGAGKPLPYWGMGDVVRVEGCQVAVDFKAGGLSSSISAAGGAASREPESGTP
jgi:hypothetical protein